MSEYVSKTSSTPCGIIDSYPLVESEPIVRCRDCYFADEIEGGYWCDRFTCGKEHVTPNGYCAWGERK